MVILDFFHTEHYVEVTFNRLIEIEATGFRCSPEITAASIELNVLRSRQHITFNAIRIEDRRDHGGVTTHQSHRRRHRQTGEVLHVGNRHRNSRLSAAFSGQSHSGLTLQHSGANGRTNDAVVLNISCALSIHRAVEEHLYNIVDTAHQDRLNRRHGSFHCQCHHIRLDSLARDAQDTVAFQTVILRQCRYCDACRSGARIRRTVHIPLIADRRIEVVDRRRNHREDCLFSGDD